MIPNEVKMEDLSGLEKLLPTLTLNLVFSQGDKSLSRKLALYRRVYVRLVDKAVDEYEEARKLVIAQVEEGRRSAEEMTRDGRYIYMFKFVDHMENCICTVRRILRFFDWLKGNQEGLQLERLARRQVEKLDSSLVAVRNTVEHMDERIRCGFIQRNEPVMLAITNTQDGVAIGGQSLRFCDLSTLTKRLHELGQHMAAWRAADSHPHHQQFKKAERKRKASDGEQSQLP